MVRFHQHAALLCLDDKHRCKVGEPGLPVAAVERGKSVVVTTSGKRFSVADHDFTKFSIKEWEALDSGDSHFFRPYIKGDNGKLQEHPCDYEVQLEQSLIWVYQQKWQKEAMARYGNHISLIDATYRTMKYELPLFFI